MVCRTYFSRVFIATRFMMAYWIGEEGRRTGKEASQQRCSREVTHR